MRPNDEPAFPRSYVADGHNGMTLRDYFASGVVSSAMASATGLGEMNPSDRADAFKTVAQIGYEMADAMLEARK